MERIRKIFDELTAARGYIQTELSLRNVSDQFMPQIEYKTPSGDAVTALFLLFPKITVDHVKQIDGMERGHIILIVMGQITQPARDIIRMLHYKVEIFLSKELEFNITQHSLVPPQTRVNDRQKRKEIIDHFAGGNEKLFPKILANDPVAKFYGFNVGDLIKVERNNGEIIYRIVVP